MRCALILAISLAAGLSVAPVARAQQAPVVLAPAELADLRGGFLVADGITLDFGAVVKTFVNGELALESRLTWTGSGPATQHVVGVVPGAIDLSTALDDALAHGLDLKALQEGEGVLLTDASGATALVHNLQGGNIQNLLINNADGRDIRQEVALTLTLPDLASMQKAYQLDRLGAQIGQDMGAVLVGLRP